jgi:hypothetical protein
MPITSDCPPRTVLEDALQPYALSDTTGNPVLALV